MAAAEWTKVAQYHGGHRFFVRSGDVRERLWVADASGGTPDRTEDGPMWVDRTRAVSWNRETGTYAIPVVLENGARMMSTVAGAPEALGIASRLGLTVEADGARFAVVSK